MQRLKENVDFTEISDYYNNLLRLASKYGRLDMVKQLQKLDDVSPRDVYIPEDSDSGLALDECALTGDSAVRLAVKHGHLEIVETFHAELEGRSPDETVDKYLVWLSVEHGQLPILKFLMKNRDTLHDICVCYPSFDFDTEEYRATGYLSGIAQGYIDILSLASSMGHLEIVEFVLKSDKSIAPSQLRYRAIKQAASKQQKHVVVLLAQYMWTNWRTDAPQDVLNHNNNQVRSILEAIYHDIRSMAIVYATVMRNFPRKLLQNPTEFYKIFAYLLTCDKSCTKEHLPTLHTATFNVSMLNQFQLKKQEST
jgi:hypothetical protein